MGCSSELQPAGLTSVCSDRQTSSARTRQGERVHAPRPDVTMVTAAYSPGGPCWSRGEICVRLQVTFVLPLTGVGLGGIGPLPVSSSVMVSLSQKPPLSVSEQTLKRRRGFVSGPQTVNEKWTEWPRPPGVPNRKWFPVAKIP